MVLLAVLLLALLRLEYFKLTRPCEDPLRAESRIDSKDGKCLARVDLMAGTQAIKIARWFSTADQSRTREVFPIQHQ